MGCWNFMFILRKLPGFGVKCRQIMTIGVEFKRFYIWDKLTLLFGFKCVYYPSPTVLFYKSFPLYFDCSVHSLRKCIFTTAWVFFESARWNNYNLSSSPQKRLGHFITKVLCELLESFFWRSFSTKLRFRGLRNSK